MSEPRSGYGDHEIGEYTERVYKDPNDRVGVPRKEFDAMLAAAARAKSDAENAGTVVEGGKLRSVAQRVRLLDHLKRTPGLHLSDGLQALTRHLVHDLNALRSLLWPRHPARVWVGVLLVISCYVAAGNGDPGFGVVCGLTGLAVLSEGNSDRKGVDRH